MALVFRTSSLANTVPTTIKNAALTYEEGDGNFAYLLTNMSGSNITIQGFTSVTGALEVEGPVTTFDGVGFWDPITTDFINIYAYDGQLVLTGSLYGTSSWAANTLGAQTASYVTASDVHGPYGPSSIQSASFAVSASWAPSAEGVIATTGSTLYSKNPSAGGPGPQFNTNHSIFFGSQSAQGADNADNAIFMGLQSGQGAFGARGCIFLGLESGKGSYGSYYSNFIGAYAGTFTTDPEYSNFIGYSAGAGAAEADHSNFIGREVGINASRARFSNFIGADAGTSATDARYSNFIGRQAGLSAKSASYSTFLGYRAGQRIGSTGPDRNNIVIGTSVTLEDGRRDSINIGGIIFGTGSYYDTTTTIATPVLGGKIGIGISIPNYTLDVSGSGNYSDGLTITGSTYISGLTDTAQSNVLTYDNTTGQVFFTASSAIGGGGSPINTGSFLTTGSLATTQQLSGSLSVTGSLNFFSGSTNAAQIENGWVVLTYVSTSLDFANDTAAAAGGVPLGGLYRNGNAISIRIA